VCKICSKNPAVGYDRCFQLWNNSAPLSPRDSKLNLLAGRVIKQMAITDMYAGYHAYMVQDADCI